MINTPDRWLIIKLPECYKVFATWAGGYLDSDRWQTNSGITKVETVGDYYLFHGQSGSIYKCHKDSYGTTAYGNSILNKILEVDTNNLIEVLDDVSQMKL